MIFREDPNLANDAETAALAKLNWPNFILEPSDIVDESQLFDLKPEEIARRSPLLGLRDENAKLIASAGLLLVSMPLEGKLPDDGFSFAVRNAMTISAPNSVCLTAVNVHPDFQSLGLAEYLLNWAKEFSQERGYSQVLVPVRPVMKDRFPLLSLAEYVALGEDPWLRLHLKLGGEIVNICDQSVVVCATLKRWRQWTGLALETTGAHVVPGGLVPVNVDVAKGFGLYIEPNVWVRYRL